MASLCRQIFSQNVPRRTISVLACLRGKLIPDRMPDPLDHATGVEKAEMLAHLAGDDDPFDVKVTKRGVGTKEQPTLVGSYFKSRLVGCICEEEQCHINWMWLHKGHPRRCGDCGHWYKLVERKEYPCD